MVKDKLPGSFYQRGGRWWWRVRLPNSEQYQAIPLVPDGARFATTDEEVARIIAADIWQKESLQAKAPSDQDRTISGLVSAYLDYAKDYYRDEEGKQTSEYTKIKGALRFLTDRFGTLPVADFGPLKMKEVRQAMINAKRKTQKVKNAKEDGEKKIIETSEAKLSRNTINLYVHCIRRAFRWGVENERCPSHILAGLEAVKGLAKGRSPARETEPVKPVHEEHIRAILPYTSKVVAAMIQIQFLTGMRPGELVIMRPCDIDTKGPVWIYRPRKFKTKFRGLSRSIPIGPKVQTILKPFLRRKVDAYCFSPREAIQEHLKRKSPIHYQDRYRPDSYRQAIEYAIAAARENDVQVPYFHPHQLRHTAGTRIRKKYGLDAARAILGHRKLGMADEYAELDLQKAIAAARKMG